MMAVVPNYKNMGGNRSGIGFTALVHREPGAASAALVPAALCWYWAGVWGLVGAPDCFFCCWILECTLVYETRYGEESTAICHG